MESSKKNQTKKEFLQWATVNIANGILSNTFSNTMTTEYRQGVADWAFETAKYIYDLVEKESPTQSRSKEKNNESSDSEECKLRWT
jgi:hypothetical protein